MTQECFLALISSLLHCCHRGNIFPLAAVFINTYIPIRFYRPGMPLLPGLSVRPAPGWDGLTDSVPALGMPVLPGLSVRPGPREDGLIDSSLGLGMPVFPGLSVRPGPGLDGLIVSLLPPPRLPEPPGLPGEPIPEPLACATREFGIV
ncbi:MAG: hypothetical protein H8K07_03270 [Nitrospira sp.]|nr:hypothetical protein [Nitrospira sp.]